MVQKSKNRNDFVDAREAPASQHGPGYLSTSYCPYLAQYFLAPKEPKMLFIVRDLRDSRMTADHFRLLRDEAFQRLVVEFGYEPTPPADEVPRSPPKRALVGIARRL